MVKSEKFKDNVKNWGPNVSINTPYLSWHYLPEMFFTYLVQTSITGLESYTSGAVYHELGMRGRLKENLGYVRNPFSLPGRGGTAAKLYNQLPSLVSENIALPKSDSVLWEEVKIFYKSIRNPLFHGDQLQNANCVELINIFDLIADIYAWVDSWHRPDSVIPGSSWFTKLDRT